MDAAAGLEIDDDGRIHLAVNASGDDGFRPHYVRLSATGAVEVLEEVPMGEVRLVTDIALDPVSGALLLALRDHSSTEDEGAVVRLEPDGDLDTNFGVGGFVDLTLEEGSWMSSIEIQSDRRIVLAGHLDANGAQQRGFFLARLLPDGDFDDEFDDNGVVRYEFDVVTNAPDGAAAMALSAGKLVAAGYATTSDVGDPRAMAVLRTWSALIFTDGFERASTSAWSSL
jgi:hypothetical protein